MVSRGQVPDPRGPDWALLELSGSPRNPLQGWFCRAPGIPPTNWDPVQIGLHGSFKQILGNSPVIREPRWVKLGPNLGNVLVHYWFFKGLLGPSRNHTGFFWDQRLFLGGPLRPLQGPTLFVGFILNLLKGSCWIHYCFLPGSLWDPCWIEPGPSWSHRGSLRPSQELAAVHRAGFAWQA